MLVDNGEATVKFFADFLRYTGDRGSHEAVMISACRDIMKVSDSTLTSDWLDAYDKQQGNEKVTMEKISYELKNIGLEQLNDEGKTALFGTTMKADLSMQGDLSYLPIIKINSYKEFEQFSQRLSNYSDLTKSAHGTEAYATMTKKYDEGIDEKKLNTIKLRVLEVEADNIVKKESKPAMIEKVYKLIMQEVDKK